MTDGPHAAVIAALDALRDALKSVQSTDAERALYQCDRLEQALRHWHAEAIRFAAYTIHHVANSAASDLGGSRDLVRQRVDDLRGALNTAGHPF
jgi:hypothetical protein